MKETRLASTTRTALVALCVLVGVLGVSAASASALNTHLFSPPSFGSAGSGAGQLSSPAGVAVNSTTHDVYVADTGNRRVDEFESNGAFVLAFGREVNANPLAVDRNVCTALETCQAGVAGSGPGQFTTPAFIAVDNSASPSTGDVYVGDTGDGLVSKFTASGALIETWGVKGQLDGSTATSPPGAFTGPFGPLAGVAIDGSGNLLVLDEVSSVFKFGQDGSFDTDFVVERGTAVRGLAVDAAGDLFKVNGDKSVEELTGSGGDVGQVTPGEEAGREATGVATDGANLYVAETGAVRLYEFTAPGVVVEPGGLTCTVAPEAPCQATDSFGSGTLSSASGIGADSNGDVIAADASANVLDRFVPVLLPDVATEPASEERPTSATLNGEVNPDGVPLSDCRFDYGTSASFGQTAPCVPSAGAIPADSAEHPVSASVTGLAPDTTYHYRLQASNADGTNTGQPSEDHEFTTPGPGLRSESVSNVASSSVTFEATISPHSAPTSYYFQYSTGDTEGCTPSSCASARGPPGEAIGAGEEEVAVTQHVQGLLTGTVYHYRVIAVSELGGKLEEFAGPDQTFTTQTAGAFALPDGRAWEMVSPPDKHGALFTTNFEGREAIQAAAAGNAMAYLAMAPTEATPQGFATVIQVLSTRGTEGWSSQDIEIPRTEETGFSTEGQEYKFFSSDLSLGALQPFGGFDPSVSAEASEDTAYLRTNYESGDLAHPCRESCYRPLVTGKVGFENVPPGTVFGVGEKGQACSTLISCGPQFVGAAPDLSHVVLTSHAALTQTPVEGGLYEWSAGALRLVSVLPASEGGAAVSGVIGSPSAERPRLASAISDDGSRVIWTASASKGLYMRVNATQPQSPVNGQGECTAPGDACTNRLDAGLAGTPRFQTANKGDSQVLFADNGDLYEYNVERGELARLTNGAQVQSLIPGQSEDGAWIYFVGDGALAPGAQAGQPNLYVRHGGSTKLVGVLSANDAPDWGRDVENAAFLSARVSPNGRWLAFMSQQKLTGFDNRDVLTGHPDEQVYLYDGQSDRLVCASCDPTGSRPLGTEFSSANGNELEEGFFGANRAWSGTATSLAALVPGWTLPLYQSRYLSDSGRLFFDSKDALVPQDVNGTWDVYQYEPQGVPQGTRGCITSSATFDERSGGCVGLISSGTSPEPSAFLDASESGGDVFFLTGAKLSTQDFDTSLDVYDAHECTSDSPCLPSPAAQPPPLCDTEASCKAAPTPQPEIFGAPASATFSGAGNVVPPAAKPPGTAKPLTRAQKLVRALKACRKKPRKQRTVCEKRARRAFGAVRKTKQVAKKGSSTR